MGWFGSLLRSSTLKLELSNDVAQQTCRTIEGEGLIPKDHERNSIAEGSS